MRVVPGVEPRPTRAAERRRRRRLFRLGQLVGLMGLTGSLAAPATAQASHLEVLEAKLALRLQAIADEVPGVMGIAVVDLSAGTASSVNGDLVFPQGSAIKIAVLLELYRQAGAGDLALSDRVPVREGDAAGGSGVLQHFGDGTSSLSLRDLAILMIVLSDNTATNLLIDRVGMDRVNRLMEALDAPRTRLRRRMIRPAASAEGRENVSTPIEAAALMVRIAACDVPVPADLCQDLRSILEIPKSGSFRDPISREVAVAWKPGGLAGVATAWGIVELPGRPYVLAAMVNYSDAPAAGDAIRRASEAVFDHFSRLAGVTPFGTRVPLRYLPRGEQVRR